MARGPQNLLWRPTETLGSSQTCCVSAPSPAVNNQLQGGHNFLKQAFPWNEKGLLKEAEKSWWVSLSKIESQQTRSKARQMLQVATYLLCFTLLRALQDSEKPKSWHI